MDKDGSAKPPQRNPQKQNGSRNRTGDAQNFKRPFKMRERQQSSSPPVSRANDGRAPARILTSPNSKMDSGSAASRPQQSTSTTANLATAKVGEVKLLRSTPHAQLLLQQQPQVKVKAQEQCEQETGNLELQQKQKPEQVEEERVPVATPPQVLSNQQPPVLLQTSTVKFMNCVALSSYFGRHSSFQQHHYHVQQQYELCLENCDKLLSEHQDFCVIGVLGQEGVGKSFIMSSLAAIQSPNGHLKHAFSQQELANILELRHETNGIDMHVVSSDDSGAPSSLGVILLDLQPLFSSSIFNEWIAKDAKLDNDVMSYENYMDLLSVQLGLFMFSICHVVLVAMDSVEDIRMLKYIQTLRMLQKGIPSMMNQQQQQQQQQLQPPLSAETVSINNVDAFNTPSHGAIEGEEKITAITTPILEYVPDIVFVYNKLDDYMMTPSAAHNIQHFLDEFFATTTFNKNSSVRPILLESEESTHVNFFMIPRLDEPKAPNISLAHFREVLYSMPKTKWAKNMSEKDWLQNSSRVWDSIQKSHFINEYNRSYQKLQLYKT